MMQFELPREYGFVALAAVSYVALTQWQSILVGRYRQKAKVAYPQAYAEKAEAEANPAAQVFNCAQRAHMQTLETMPSIMFLTLFVGLKYPLLASISGAVWTFSRILFTNGYTTGVPSKRGFGARLGYVPSIALLGGGTWSAVDMILSYVRSL